MTAYYNEFDPKAAAWLRELIADGLIAPGEVDERDIRDVTPDELRPFRQVHLFAGIGGWSASLRKAGWADDDPVWTASCPCQPFSAAGARGGFADERHLWPAVYHLATQCGPDVLLGEQSSSKDGLAWFDLVSADMEAAGYAGGALDLCSAGFGAPNIRQRSYFVWMADAAREQHNRAGGAGSRGRAESPNRRDACRLAYSDGRNASAEGLQRGGEHGQRTQDGSACRVDDTAGPRQFSTGRGEPSEVKGNGGVWRGLPRPRCAIGRPGQVNGFWQNADWIGCTDGVWRPVEPGSFPLAPSVPGRVALLRGAGNAINVEVAAGFIEAVMAVRAQAERLAA
jgi:DNA (cytosine-5)-methyltransferase 1